MASLFLLNLSIARNFGAISSGNFFFQINTLSLIVILTSLSLESGITYFLSRDEIPQSAMLNFSLAWSMSISLIASIVLISFPHDNTNGSSGWSDFLTDFIFLFGNLLILFSTAILNARKDFITSNASSLILTLFLCFAIWSWKFSNWMNLDFSRFRFLYFLSIPLQGLWIHFYLMRKMPYRTERIFPTLNAIRKLFRFGLFALASNLIFFLVYRIDYWFVARFCNESELGTYIQVSKVGQFSVLIPSLMASVIFPATAREKGAGMIPNIAKFTRATMGIMSILALTLLIIGNKIFPWLLGNDFPGLYHALIFLLPGIVALGTLYPITAYYAGRHEFKKNREALLVSLSIIIIGDLLFVPVYGIRGAAGVSSLGYICYCFLMIRNFCKDSGMPMHELLKWNVQEWMNIMKSMSHKSRKDDGTHRP